MAKIYHSLDELVGNTPLLELTNYEKELGLKAHLLGKLEYFNPSGSIKDRIAKYMIEKAEEEGLIKPNGKILDFTSGNTGIATAALANAKGYHYVVVLQPGVSAERTQILKAYGAELVDADAVPGFMDMLREGLTMRKLTPIMEAYAKKIGAFYLNQGCNPYNVEAHYVHTGREIWKDTDGQVDYLVAMVGTGGTLAGVSRYLREKNPNIKVIAAQPHPISRKHPDHPEVNTIDGVLAFHNAPTLPAFWTEETLPYDRCLDIIAEDAYETGRRLVKTDGVFLGQSAAAAVKAATEIAKLPEAEGKNIVIMLADNAFKYLSTNIYR